LALAWQRPGLQTGEKAWTGAYASLAVMAFCLAAAETKGRSQQAWG
jgi:hypothetical protein